MKKNLEEISLTKGEYGGGFIAVEFNPDRPRYVRITDINDSGKLNKEPKSPSGSLSEWEKYTLQDGDLLFARSGATVGKTFLYENGYGNCVFAGYLIRFRLKKDIADPKYVYYFTKSSIYNSWVVSKQNVVAQPNINAKQYGKELQIPLPPLATQKKIAAILDAADAHRQKTKQLLAKYDELAQSIFLEMFGDPVTNPKGWEVVPTIVYSQCIVPGRDKPKSFSGDIPWITTADVNHLGYTRKSRLLIGLSDFEINEVRARIIPKGSVIMTCVGDLGVVSINREDIVMNQQLHAFICGEKLNNVFLMYNLSFQTPYMYKMASSTTVPYMNKTVANNTPTIVPPLELQITFSELIKAVNAQKEQVKSNLKKTDKLFNSLLQRAFKGELVK